MPDPRFRRRKDDRPAEITAAAMAEFAENGYDATPVEAVARRAGVSKGLLYLYFRTKEELFKAVVRSVVSPRIDRLVASIEDTHISVEAFLRGPFLDTARELPRSRARHFIRLMIAEGPKHPDLTEWYWRNVVSKGLGALETLIARGVERGELRPSALQRFPQLLLSPVMLSVIWTLIMQRHQPLDTDAFIEAHIDLVLDATLAHNSTSDAG
ncbi:MAG: TetR/AcrR family transcriptional regulator [Woeseiaceae bacterium]|nr:TetR/AcrR family transcriptional regulator [Woeseiaceae bacterium]